MKLRRCILGSVALLVVIAVAIAGIVWYHHYQQLENAKLAFLTKLQGAMEEAIQTHFWMHQELPTKGSQLVPLQTEIRAPWVFNGMIRFGFNRPNLEAGWMNCEELVFQKAIASCRDKVPDWRNQLNAARQPLIQREGKLQSQLDLFADSKFDVFAGYGFLTELHKNEGVEVESLARFIKAFQELRSLRDLPASVFRPMDPATSGNGAQRKPENPLESAMDEFQQAKKMILAEVRDRHSRGKERAVDPGRPAQ